MVSTTNPVPGTSRQHTHGTNIKNPNGEQIFKTVRPPTESRARGGPVTSRPATATAVLDVAKDRTRSLSWQRISLTPSKPENGANKWQILIRVLPIIACTLGLVSHAYIVTKEYLAYEMVTSTSVSLRDVFVPPAISICIPFTCMPTYLPLYCKVIKYEGVPEFCDLNMVPLDELMFKHSPDLSETLNFWDNIVFWWYMETDVFENEARKQMTSQYFYDDHKCIKIPTSTVFPILTADDKSDIKNSTYRYMLGKSIPDMRFVPKYVERRKIEDRLQEIFLTDLKLNIKRITNGTFHINRPYAPMSVIMHDKNMYPHRSDNPSVLYEWNSDKEANAIKFLYNQINTIYLEYPFEHKCKNYNSYTNPRIESRGDCIEQCSYAKLYDRYRGNVSERLMTQHSIFSNRTTGGAWNNDDIDKECHGHCTVDCDTNYFSSIVLHKWLYNQTIDRYPDVRYPEVELTRDYLRLQMASYHPITKVQYTVKFDLISYLIFVGGIIGMWVGIDFLYIGTGFTSSMLSFSQWTWKAVERIKTKIQHGDN